MNVKRKILFVNSSISGGGAGKALIYLLKAMDRNKIDPIVILPSDGVIGEEIRKLGVSIEYLPLLPERFGKTRIPIPDIMKQRPVQELINVALMIYFSIKVAIIAKKQKADVICSNHQYHTPICIGAGYLTGKSVNIYSREYIEGFWPQLCFRILAKAKPVKTIFSVSEVAGELYKGSGKLRVLHDCMDFEGFKRASIVPNLRSQTGIPSDGFVFGFVGRLIERKGVDFLIRAFALVASKHPQVYLAVVGGNDPGLSYDLLACYKSLASELKLGNRIFFAGFLKDVRPAVHDFNCLVLPSLNPEPFGMVFIESAILGIPCIVPSNSGVAETVQDGENGFVFHARSEAGLAKTMEKVLAAKENLNSVAQEAYHRAQKKFDILRRSVEVTQAFLD